MCRAVWRSSSWPTAWCSACARRSHGRAAFPAIELRPLLLISAAVALFAVLLSFAGLALTSLAVVICAGFAAYDVRLHENAILAVALSGFAVVLFVKVLGLPMPVWPW